MRRIRIIHILCKLEPGGAERMVLELARALPKERYEVSVVATHGGGALEQEFRDAGIPLHLFHTRTRLGLGTLLALARILRKIKPDVVHTHLFAGDMWGRVAAMIAFPFRRPVIIATEHNTNFDEGVVKRWVKWALQFVTDRVVAVSDAVREYSMRIGGIRSKKITVVRHGVHQDVIASAAKQSPGIATPRQGGARNDGGVTIGCIARLEPQKGHTILLDAFKKLQATSYPATAGPSDRGRSGKLQASPELWLVGDGSLRGVLEVQARELGIADRVKFFGSRTDVAALLEQMDIVALPSRWEGAGLALLEAQAAGKPVVASAVGGVGEYVRDGVTGLLVKPADAHALEEALMRLITDSALRQQMGEAGRTFVTEKFTLERMVSEYTALYYSLLQATSYPATAGPSDRGRSGKLQAPHLRDAVVAVTYLCQSRCNMCSIWMNKTLPKLSPADMRLLPKSLWNINISGGEPFLRPDLPEMIAEIKHRVPKAKIIISSNGFATARILSHMKTILTIDPKIGAAISIDGIGAMHDRVRGIPGGFRMCVETVRGLQRLGMKNIRIAFTAQDMNVEHLPMVHALARSLGVDFTMSAVHNSAHYFQKEDNRIRAVETFDRPYQEVITAQLKRWSPKQLVFAYYMDALLEFLKTGKRRLPNYGGVRSFFLDPNRRLYPSVASAFLYGTLAVEESLESLMKRQPEKTKASRQEQHWMMCTAREAMRMHVLRVGWWVLKNKTLVHLQQLWVKVNTRSGMIARYKTFSSVYDHS